MLFEKSFPTTGFARSRRSRSQFVSLSDRRQAASHGNEP
jgi:hypothetical protein